MMWPGSPFGAARIEQARREERAARARSEAATLHMAHQALADLTPRQWVMVIENSFNKRRGELPIPDVRALSSLLDRGADEEERGT